MQASCVKYAMMRRMSQNGPSSPKNPTNPTTQNAIQTLAKRWCFSFALKTSEGKQITHERGNTRP